MSRRRGAWLLALLALCLGTPAIAEPAVSEERLKLAYLYNFAQFIDWPADRLPPGATLRLCVLGPERFGADLDALAQRQVRSHPLAISRPTSAAELQACHIVYAERLELPGQARPKEGSKGQASLWVSSQPGALRQGAVIQFVMLNTRLRWHLDQDNARRAGLNVSAKLLELSLPAAEAPP